MSEDKSGMDARLDRNPERAARPPASISSYNPYAPAPNASGSTSQSNMGQFTPVEIPDELRRAFAVQIPEDMRREFTVQGRRSRASSYSHPPPSMPPPSDTSNAFPDLLDDDEDSFDDVPTTWNDESEIPTTSRPRGQSRPRSQSMREGVPLDAPRPHPNFGPGKWKEGQPLFPEPMPALQRAGKVVLDGIHTLRRSSMVSGQRKYFYDGTEHDHPPPPTPKAPTTPKTPLRGAPPSTPTQGDAFISNPYGRGTNSPPLDSPFHTAPPVTPRRPPTQPRGRLRRDTTDNLFGVSQSQFASSSASPSNGGGRPSLADLGLTLGQEALQWVFTSPAGEAYGASHAHPSSEGTLPVVEEEPVDEMELRGGAGDDDGGAVDSYDSDFEEDVEATFFEDSYQPGVEVAHVKVAPRIDGPNDNGVARFQTAQSALRSIQRDDIRRRMSLTEQPNSLSAHDSQFAIATGADRANANAVQAPKSALRKSQTCNDLVSLSYDADFSDQAEVHQGTRFKRVSPWVSAAPPNMGGGGTLPGPASIVTAEGHMTMNDMTLNEQGSSLTSFPPIEASTSTNQNTRNSSTPPVKYHTFYQQVLQTTDSAEINRRIAKANSEGFVKHNIGSGPRRTPLPPQARDEGDPEERLATHNQPRPKRDLINRKRETGFTPVARQSSQRHVTSKTPRTIAPSRPLPAIPTTSTPTPSPSQSPSSSGRSTPVNMNNYASFGDGQQMGNGRQAPSPGGMIGNVMGGPPPQMNAVPMPAGHQADLSYILNTVEQLQDQLASNKATSDDIVRKTGIVRQRAIEREQKADEVMKAAEKRLAEQGKNMDEALSKMRAELNVKSGKADYWRTLALRAGETLANQNKLLHEMKVKTSDDILWWHTSYRDQLADEREENLRLRNQIVDMQASAARGNEALRQFRRIYDRSDLFYELKTQIVFHRQNARAWKRQAMKLLPDDDSEFSDDDDLIDPQEKKRQAAMNAEAKAKRELMEEREAQGLDPKTELPRHNYVQATEMRREYEPRSFAPQNQTIESFVTAAVENAGAAGFGNNTNDPRAGVDDLSALADSMGLPPNMPSCSDPEQKTGLATSGTAIDADKEDDDDNNSVISVNSDMSESTKVLVDLMKNGLRGNTMYPMSDSEEENDDDEKTDGTEKKEPHNVGGLFGNKVKENKGGDKKDDDSKGGDGASKTSATA